MLTLFYLLKLKKTYHGKKQNWLIKSSIINYFISSLSKFIS